MTRRQAILAAIASMGLVAALYFGIRGFNPEKHVLIATWNVRGYPEKTQAREEWFSEKLAEIELDALYCSMCNIYIERYSHFSVNG